MKKYRAVVIGCGIMGIEEKKFGKAVQPGTHAAAYDKNPRIILAGLADISKERRDAACTYYPRVPIFSSAKEMLDRIKPDIVSIATQPDSHAQLTMLAASHKTKAIVCEKPIASNVKEGKAMIKACKKSGSLLFIDHGRRFDPLLQTWKKRIHDGLIGDVIQVSCYSYNGLFNNGTHTIDLLRLFLGEPRTVRGWINNKTTSLVNDPNVDALLEFPKNVRVTLQTLSKNYGYADYHFYGTKGLVIIKQLGYKIEYIPLIESSSWKGYYQLSPNSKTVGKARSFMKSMASHIVSCLDKNATPLSSGEEGLRDLEILLAIKKSASRNASLIKIA